MQVNCGHVHFKHGRENLCWYISFLHNMKVVRVNMGRSDAGKIVITEQNQTVYGYLLYSEIMVPGGIAANRHTVRYTLQFCDNKFTVWSQMDIVYILLQINFVIFFLFLLFTLALLPRRWYRWHLDGIFWNLSLCSVKSQNSQSNLLQLLASVSIQL